MFDIKLFFFCFAAAFITLSGVNSFVIPPKDVTLSCVPVCEGQLQGKTYTCELYSARGTVSMVVRMIVDLNWRFYHIPLLEPQIDFCRKVALADNFFINGTKACYTSLRSDVNMIGQKDSSELQSSLRAEDMKDLIKELNKDTKEVLSELSDSSKGDDLSSLKRAFTKPKKTEIKFILDKLVKHLTIVGLLSSDVKLHSNGKGDSSQHGRPSHHGRPGHQGRPSHHGRPKHHDRPKHHNRPSHHERPSYPGYPKDISHPSGTTHSKYPVHPSDSSHMNHHVDKIPYHIEQNNYNTELDHNTFQHFDHNKNYESSNFYDYNVKLGMNTIYNVNPGPSNYIQDYDNNFGSGYHPGKNSPHHGFGKRKDEPIKVDDVKELASQLKEDSSALLNELETTSPSEVTEKKKRLFNLVVRRLNGLVEVADSVEANQTDTKNEAKTDEKSEASTDSEDDSQSVDKYPPLEKQSDSASKKRKFTHDTSGEHGECPLCSVVMKDICNDGMIATCTEKSCCWVGINPYHCMAILNDNKSIVCYNSLFSIFQSIQTV